MHTNETADRAVSPVAGVILVVAITVALAAVIGVFALDLGKSTTDGGAQQSLGVQTSVSDGTATASVVTGKADELRLLVNGTEVDSTTDVTAGTTLSGPASSDADVSVVTVDGGDERVVARTTSSSEPGSVAPTPPTDGLIHHYALDGDATDAAGDNDGTLTNAAFSTDEERGEAIEFGGDGYVTLDEEAGQYPADSFTVSAWVKPTDPTNGHDTILDLNAAMSSDTDREGGIWFSINGDGRPILRYSVPDNKDATQKADTAIPADEWTHIIATRNHTANEVTFYIDGERGVNETGTAGSVIYDYSNYDDDSAHIGRFARSGSSNYYFNGRVSDVRIYNRVINETKADDLKVATK